jgi:hypothetical protein
MVIEESFALKQPIKFILLCFLIFGALSLSAQKPDTLWTKTYGGDYDDAGRCVQETPDGGYIIAGYKSVDHGGKWNKDIVVIKTDGLGNKDWERAFGSDEYDDEGYWVELLPGGEYAVVTGYTKPPSSTQVVWAAKLAVSNGSTAGEGWEQTYTQAIRGWCIKNASDGGFIIVADAPSSGMPMLVKLYSNGTKAWHQSYGSHFSGTCYGKKEVVESTNGGFALVGEDHSYGGAISGFILQTDSSGDFLRIKEDEGYFGAYLYNYTSVYNTYDSGYIIAGKHCSGGDYHLFVRKRDSIGEKEWCKTFYNSGDWWGNSIMQLHDSNYIVSGGGANDLFVAKIDDASGDTIWTKRIGGANSDVGNCVRETSDYNYIAVGGTTSYGAGGSDIYLVKIGTLSQIKIEDKKNAPKVFSCAQNYPNPFNINTTIRYGLPKSSKVCLEVYNLAGQKIQTLVDAEQSAGYKTASWDGRTSSGKEVPQGIYFYVFKAGDFAKNYKMIVIR